MEGYIGDTQGWGAPIGSEQPWMGASAPCRCLVGCWELPREKRVHPKSVAGCGAPEAP